MRAIVVYASKYGSTKGIAEFIADKLQERAIPTDVEEVGAVENAADYDAFVIGSGVYMFHWLKEAKQFVSKNRALLASRPVWLFSSGPVGTQSKDAKGRDLVEVSGPKELDQLRALVKPRDHKVFFGAFYGERLTGMIGLGYRMAKKSKSAREAMPEGDFRDWKEIEAWANTIASALEAPNKAPYKVSSSQE